MAVLSTASKWPDLGIWVADGRFHIVPRKQFISGQMAVLSRPASRSGHGVKADSRFTKAGIGHMARSLDLGCGWPISYCPVQAVYQQPGRAIFSKGWESEWPLYQSRSGDGIKADGRFYQGRQAPVAVLSTMPALSRPCYLKTNCRFIKRDGRLPMAALSRPYKATMAALSRLKSRNGRFINRK